MPTIKKETTMDYNITEWGDEHSPILFQIEPEFGLDGYKGILEAELVNLEHKIEQKGIGKDGEKYAISPLPTPEVSRSARKKNISSKQFPHTPQWQKRYTQKNQQPTILRRLLTSQPLRHIKNLTNRCIKNAVWSASPPPEKISRSVSLISDFFHQTKHLLCLSEPFWLANKRFIMNFFSTENRTIISQLEAPLEMQESLTVPLRRFNMTSLEGWLRCQNLCSAEDYMLIMSAKQANQAVTLLANAGQSKPKALIITENLSEEIASRWETAIQIDKNLWFTEGLKEAHPEYKPPSPQPGSWPKISMVVVSYNQAAYFQDCLDSILDQNYPNLECIVVDGQSTDGTDKILETYRERLTHLIIEPDKCQSEALNKGFRLATGDIMTWICSDDLLEKEALFQVAKAFTEYSTDLVAGGCRIINGAGKNLCNHQNGLPFESICRLSFGDLLSFIGVWERGMYFYQPDLFFSKKIWELSGSYIKEHLHFAMDYDLFLRFAMAGAKIVHIPAYLAIRRVHEMQKTQHKTMTYLPTIRNLLIEYKEMIESIKHCAQYNTENSCF